MKHILLAASFGLFAGLAGPVAAQDAGQKLQDALIGQLTQQGFTRVRVSNTMLGRVRIYATSPGKSREIIFNPRTGEILRDYWDDEDDDDDDLFGTASGSSGSSSGGGDSSDDRSGPDDRDDDSDDDSDDDKDDDSDDDKDDDEDDSDDDKDEDDD